jgi:hypothetical protein
MALVFLFVVNNMDKLITKRKLDQALSAFDLVTVDKEDTIRIKDDLFMLRLGSFRISF